MMPKFRAWDKVSETMYRVEGIRFGINGARVISLVEMNRYNNNTRWHTDVELLQFTGLKDRNGVEIFEGDILYHKLQGAGVVFYPYRDTMASFGIRNIKYNLGTTLKDTAKAGYEIIGNKYEHPHLLEE